MSKGLFKSIYGKTDEGIFPDLYERQGSSPATQRMDIRLGDYSFGQEDDDDDDEDEAKAAPATPTPAPTIPTPAPAAAGKMKLPEAPGGAVKGPSVFSQDKDGFPMWLVGVFLLGFAVAWRQKKKSTTA